MRSLTNTRIEMDWAGAFFEVAELILDGTDDHLAMSWVAGPNVHNPGRPH